jgi:hypothetical protein
VAVKLFWVWVASGLSFDGFVSLLAGSACLPYKIFIGIVGCIEWCCVSRAVLLCWWCGAVDIPLGRDSACTSPHAS